MSVLPFIPAQREYDPQILRLMGDVFDKVSRQHPSIEVERIAHTIIGFARKDIDGDALCALVLKHLLNRP